LKANPKLKADLKPEPAPKPVPKSSRKMWMIILGLLCVSAFAGTAWYVWGGSAGSGALARSVSPYYVPIDEFTVNLQPEDGDKYLQTKFTLQVADDQEVELIKANMPKVRNRVLLLLSSKKASEISTPEGKRRLQAEIIAALRQPFIDKGAPQQVSDLLFISFIIQ
jgi:flagellar FliL protein